MNIKTYRVDTRGKKSVKRPGAKDLSNNQVVRFSLEVAENTPWIKEAILRKHLVEIGGESSPEPVVQVTEKPPVAPVVVEETPVVQTPEPVAVVEAETVEEMGITAEVVDPVVVEETPAEETKPRKRRSKRDDVSESSEEEASE